MDPPIVYIEKEPFVNIVLSSIETFRRECFGYVFGYKRNGYFVITNVIAVQLAQKRKNTEIEQSKGSELRMRECIKKYPRIFPMIGDFHSHPEWGGRQQLAEASDSDIKDMIRNKYQLGVIVKISSINKDRILWQAVPKGGVRGSLGKYKFHIIVCRVLKDKKGKHVCEYLQVNARSAVRALNRALGYEL